MRVKRLIHISIFLFLLFLLSLNKLWGENHSHEHSTSSNKKKNFFERQKIVFIPLALSAGFYISGLDYHIEQFSRQFQPVFGSTLLAQRRSDQFRTLLKWEAIVVTLLSLDAQKHWNVKIAAMNFSQFIIGYSLTINATYALKHLTHRKRPDNSNLHSFPSAHVSSATFFTLQIMNHINMNYIPGSISQLIKWESVLLTGAVGWGRIEGNKHYVSDVLGGVAVALFMNNVAKICTQKIGKKFYFQVLPFFDNLRGGIHLYLYI